MPSRFSSSRARARRVAVVSSSRPDRGVMLATMFQQPGMTVPEQTVSGERIPGFTVPPVERPAQVVYTGCIIRYDAPAGCLGAVEITGYTIPAIEVPGYTVPGYTLNGTAVPDVQIAGAQATEDRVSGARTEQVCQQKLSDNTRYVASVYRSPVYRQPGYRGPVYRGPGYREPAIANANECPRSRCRH